MPVVVAALAVMFLALGLWWSPATLARGPDRGDTVAILPFRVAGAAPALHYLGEGMVDLLSSELDAGTGPRAVDPRAILAAARSSGGAVGISEALGRRLARRFGARDVLEGEIVGRPQRLVVQATLERASDGAVRAQARATGPEDSLSQIVDDVAAQLLLRSAGEDEAHVARLADRPIGALRLYLRAQHAYRVGDYQAAANGYAAALRQDSSFLLAGLGIMTAARFTPDALRITRVSERVWRHRSRLPMDDRYFLNGLLGGGPPNGPNVYAKVLSAWTRAVRVMPDRAEAWYELGDVTFHWGALLGVADHRARARADFQRALSLDPGFVAPAEHLLRLAALRGDRAGVRRMRALILARDSTNGEADFVRWRAAVALKDAAALGRLRARLPSLDLETLWRIVGVAQLTGRDMADADRAMALALQRAGTAEEQVVTTTLAHDLALNEGRPRAAARYLTAHPRVVAAWRLDVGHIVPIFDALFDHGDSARAERLAREAVRERAAAPAGTLPADYVISAPWLALHDGVRIPRLAGFRRTNDVVVVEAVASAVRHDEDAPARLRDLARLANRGVGYLTRPALQLLVARVALAEGDSATALAALRRRPYEWDEAGLLAPSLLMEARLARRLGRRAEAIRAYRHYLTLRRRPEPAVMPEVAAARSALASLEAVRVAENR